MRKRFRKPPGGPPEADGGIPVGASGTRPESKRDWWLKGVDKDFFSTVRNEET